MDANVATIVSLTLWIVLGQFFLIGACVTGSVKTFPQFILAVAITTGPFGVALMAIMFAIFSITALVKKLCQPETN